MSTLRTKQTSIPRKYGLLLFALFTGFFLLMRAAGLAHVYWLRSLNVVWLLLGVFAAVKAYKKAYAVNVFDNFFDYFSVAMRTAFIGIGLFSIALAIYLDLLDPAFMAELQEYESFGGLVSPVSASALIFIEGMASAFICSYISIQLLKTRMVEKPTETKMQHDEALKASK
jgi:hypothetical protein